LTAVGNRREREFCAQFTAGRRQVLGGYDLSLWLYEDVLSCAATRIPGGTYFSSTACA